MNHKVINHDSSRKRTSKKYISEETENEVGKQSLAPREIFSFVGTSEMKKDFVNGSAKQSEFVCIYITLDIGHVFGL